MQTIILGIFLLLHGGVHLLYAGQSKRLFELRPAMTWPDESWLFRKVFPVETTRWVATILLGLAALGFIAAGLGAFLGQGWWLPLTVGSAVFSILIFLLFWDGRLKALDAQGGIGILLNLATIVVVQILS